VLILVECVHVRLHRSFTLHEDDADGVAGKPGNESLRILDHTADSAVGRKRPQNIRLELSDGHGKDLRCVQRPVFKGPATL
jgi:hypothetical protein